MWLSGFFTLQPHYRRDLIRFGRMESDNQQGGSSSLFCLHPPRLGPANGKLSLSFQVNHINKLCPFFKHHMVIIIREKILDAM